jgi:hypothetical protein
MIDNGDFYGKKGRVRKEFRIRLGTLLSYVVSQNNIEAVAKLFERGVQINDYVFDSLYLAIVRKHYEMAELLLSNGVRVRSKHRLAECLVNADERMREIIRAYVK